MKETYRHHSRRLKEEILAHIHSEGDVLGVVRIKGFEHVTTRNKTLKRAAKGDDTLRTKERFALLDSGCPLLAARTVNDLLETVYDALEGAYISHCDSNCNADVQFWQYTAPFCSTARFSTGI